MQRRLVSNILKFLATQNVWKYENFNAHTHTYRKINSQHNGWKLCGYRKSIYVHIQLKFYSLLSFFLPLKCKNVNMLCMFRSKRLYAATNVKLNIFGCDIHSKSWKTDATHTHTEVFYYLAFACKNLLAKNGYIYNTYIALHKNEYLSIYIRFIFLATTENGKKDTHAEKHTWSTRNCYKILKLNVLQQHNFQHLNLMCSQ